jgi:hypothetical protein
MKNIHLLPTEKPTGLFKLNDKLQYSILNKPRNNGDGYHIYITSDEEIKKGDWYLSYGKTPILCSEKNFENPKTLKLENKIHQSGHKKIILTTDQYLIEDDVQSIDDEFLEWFVKNPSCEEVGIVKELYVPQANGKISDGKISHEISLDPLNNTLIFYKIIIPKKEPVKDKWEKLENSDLDIPLKTWDNKQEALEEAAIKYAESKSSRMTFQQTHIRDFKQGAKWQSERMFSEEDMEESFIQGAMTDLFNTWDISNEDMAKEKFKIWFEKFKKK